MEKIIILKGNKIMAQIKVLYDVPDSKHCNDIGNMCEHIKVYKSQFGNFYQCRIFNDTGLCMDKNRYSILKCLQCLEAEKG